MTLWITRFEGKSFSSIISLLFLATVLRISFIYLTLHPSVDLRLRRPLSQPTIFTLLTSTSSRRKYYCENRISLHLELMEIFPDKQFDQTHAVHDTWLKFSDYSYIFSSTKLNPRKYKYTAFRYPQRHPWFIIRSELLWVSDWLPHFSDWYLFTDDSSLILIDSLKYSLEVLNPDKRFFAYLGQGTKDHLPIIVLSRGAAQYLNSRILHNEDGCDLRTGSLRKCLQVGVELDLQKDSQGLWRSYTVTRHFVPEEKSKYEAANGGEYNDGMEELSQVSPELISLHGLSTSDLVVYHILFSRIKLMTVQNQTQTAVLKKSMVVK